MCGEIQTQRHVVISDQYYVLSSQAISALCMLCTVPPGYISIMYCPPRLYWFRVLPQPSPGADCRSEASEPQSYIW